MLLWVTDPFSRNLVSMQRQAIISDSMVEGNSLRRLTRVLLEKAVQLRWRRSNEARRCRSLRSWIMWHQLLMSHGCCVLFIAIQYVSSIIMSSDLARRWLLPLSCNEQCISIFSDRFLCFCCCSKERMLFLFKNFETIWKAVRQVRRMLSKTPSR